jgi:hypothetical protein
MWFVALKLTKLSKILMSHQSWWVVRQNQHFGNCVHPHYQDLSGYLIPPLFTVLEMGWCMLVHHTSTFSCQWVSYWYFLCQNFRTGEPLLMLDIIQLHLQNKVELHWGGNSVNIMCMGKNICCRISKTCSETALLWYVPLNHRNRACVFLFPKQILSVCKNSRCL